MTTSRADTPDEVRVAEEWLREALAHLDGRGEAPAVTVEGPFRPGETPIYDRMRYLGWVK